MGNVSGSPKDNESPARQLLRQCEVKYKKELDRAVRELQRIKREYTVTGKKPFGVDENPEVQVVVNTWMRQVTLGTLGGGLAAFMLARGWTRWHTPATKFFVRANATMFGAFFGGTWAGTWGIDKMSVQYLEKSTWAPKLICNTVEQFKPCVEDYGCREELVKNKWGRTFAECYQVCQRRQSVWIHEARARARRLGEEEADVIPGSILTDDHFEPEGPSLSSSTSSEFEEDEATSKQAGGNEFFELSGPSEEETDAFNDGAKEDDQDRDSRKNQKRGWWGR